MPHLLIVLDPEDPDARAAAGVYHFAHGPGVEHPAGMPLPPLEWFSVLFVGPPPADVLAFALAEARAVCVLATYEPDILPRGLLWASGPTLREAARQGTGR
ncbi:MAG: hypothetical protein O9289_17435 [Rhodobacteraceae bacterium]|nr:hypothetical protein [Paracoccaceae bacterium]MCZ8084984.1 hypothetical protein [Paracoccaceae bacterium]